jgi:hypothetical protein
MLCRQEMHTVALCPKAKHIACAAAPEFFDAQLFDRFFAAVLECAMERLRFHSLYPHSMWALLYRVSQRRKPSSAGATLNAVTWGRTR